MYIRKTKDTVTMDHMLRENQMMEIMMCIAALIMMINMRLTCILGLSPAPAPAPAKVPAMFVFGDSLVDNGNNNFLASLARANYYPYGCDFDGGSSGRFSNGRTIVDMLGALLGLPYVPAFGDPNTSGSKVLRGVNYASAAAGILDETGQYFGERYSLSQQVANFESTVKNEVRRMMSEGNTSEYLAKSIAVMVFGSNDYINNYLLAPIYTSSYNYTPPAYAAMLLDRYARQILALHAIGLRKFLISGIGPLGCIPSQRASGGTPPGRCAGYVNDMLVGFNEGLKSLLDTLNRRNHPGAVFVYGNSYGAFLDILGNAASYGFKVVDRACCGIGRNQGQITCMPLQVPCADRGAYLFWDAFHPTDAANAVFAWRAYSGTPADCYPFNVKQMALL